MANGRCRMHGGLSTGPRTAEGLARCRRTRLVHGFRGRPIRQFRRRAIQAARHLRGLNDALRLALRHGILAGHGLHRPDSMLSAAPAIPANKSHHGDHRAHGGSARLSDAKYNPPSSLSASSSVVNSTSAGHGVHRLELLSSTAPIQVPTTIGVHPPARSPLRRAKAGPRSSAVSTTVPAGHGVHRPVFVPVAAGWPLRAMA
ncbi:MAG: HGGxSTG domain-containing protein [Dongiaceae bacterium]